MGKNIRFARHYDKLMEDRLLVEIAKRGPLQTLDPRELELDKLPVTIDPEPDEARAWVRFGAYPVLVDVLVDRWTKNAVGVRFMVGETEMRCWVYQGAMRPKPAIGKQGDRYDP